MEYCERALYYPADQLKLSQFLPTPESASPSGLLGQFGARDRDRKRKRSPEDEVSQQAPLEKRWAGNNGDWAIGGIDYWLQEGTWPKGYFEPSHQTWEDLKAETLVGRIEADDMNPMNPPPPGPLAKRKSAASMRRQTVETSIGTLTEKDDKSLPYRSPAYRVELAMKGSHMNESPEGPAGDSVLFCRSLLISTQSVPSNTLFRDDLFEETCRKLLDRNEARIVEDISPLLAPSAETLATYGASELKHLVFNVNERWGESIPITDVRPQPDRCAGFSRFAFTEDQLQKLRPYLGSLLPVNYFSVFLATWRMMFPFFACEAKSGVGELDVADKQNAHSMSMAVRGVVELFKLVRCEDEIHRKILALSISHDDKSVRMYGYYADIKEGKATYYRHLIRNFGFTEQNGKDKWTAYHFTTNVYLNFMPKLHKLLCSAIDKISSDTPSIPMLSQDQFDSAEPESDPTDSQEMAAANPSSSQNSIGAKRKRLTANAVLQQQLANRDEYADALNLLRRELETQRQESEAQRQENERQKQRNEEQVCQLMDTITKLAAKS